jgi:hypothetical protein
VLSESLGEPDLHGVPQSTCGVSLRVCALGTGAKRNGGLSRPTDSGPDKLPQLSARVRPPSTAMLTPLT